MNFKHKNKTLSVFLSFILGSFGAHRFYLYGKRDPIAWLHLLSLPLAFLFSSLYFNLNPFVTYAPWLFSLLAGIFMSLILGLKSDARWDQQYNPQSEIKSDSSWLLALLLVFATGTGAIVLIGMMARAFDLLYTGGAYG